MPDVLGVLAIFAFGFMLWTGWFDSRGRADRWSFIWRTPVAVVAWVGSAFAVLLGLALFSWLLTLLLTVTIATLTWLLGG